MKKVPMILLLIAPYAIVFLCDQTGLDFSIGLWIYSALLTFNMVYAFLLPRLGFRVKQLLFWNLLLKLWNIPLVLMILLVTLVPRKWHCAVCIGFTYGKGEYRR